MAKKSHITVRPATDIIRTEKSIEIILNLPGVDPNHVKLEIIKNRLLLQGHLTLPHKAKEQIVCLEFTECHYETQLLLSEEIDTESLEAHMSNGVLTIRLGYIKGMEPKMVPISS